MKYLGRALGAVLAAALAACGGGGGASGNGDNANLEILLTYPDLNTVSALEATTIRANILGMNGVPPTCRIASGALPDGMKLNAGNCDISGTPTKTGDFAFDVEITAKGYKGEVRAPFGISVHAPSPRYGWQLGSTTLVWAMDYGMDLPGIDFYTRKSGDVVKFKVTGVLPAGLTFDESTGAISGTPSEYGSFQPNIELSLSRNGTTVVWLDSGTMTVRPPLLSVQYPTDVTFQVGVTGRLYLSQTNFFSEPGDIFSVELIAKDGCPAALPPGFTIDNSGSIEGAPQTAFNTCAGVRYRYQRGVYVVYFETTARLVAQQ